MTSELRTFATTRLRNAVASAVAPVTLIVGEPSATRAALAALRVDGSVFYPAAGARTLRAFVRGVGVALAPLAPAARTSFGLAYDRAMQTRDPVAALAAWLAAQLRAVDAALLVDGVDGLGAEAGSAVRFLALAARDNALRCVVATTDVERYPVASWLADELIGVPIELDAEQLPAFDGPLAPPDAAEPPAATARDRLEAAVARGDASQVRERLELDGFELLDNGDRDVLDDALDLIERDSVGVVSATLLGQREARRRRSDTSEAWFRFALERAADRATYGEVLERFAREFLRNHRPDVLALLQESVDDQRIPAATRALMSALIADERAKAGDAAGALTVLDRVLAGTDQDERSLRAARWRTRAAIVYVHVGERERAERLAHEAVAIADGLGHDRIALSALSVLQRAAYESRGPRDALVALYALAERASRTGDGFFHLYGLAGAYEFEAERGDRDALERIERDLRAYDLHFASAEVAEALVPGRALVLAWSGRFAAAFELLHASLDHVHQSAEAALRAADVAVFAAAAGDGPGARAALERTRLDDPPPAIGGHRIARAALLAAVARALLGETVALPDRQRLGPREQALLDASAAVIALTRGASPGAAASLLERLHAFDYGGIARLYAALPVHRRHQ